MANYTEKVMEHFTVLPIKFGTLMPDRADVVHVLRQGYSLFSQTLTALKGRVEVEVVSTWDLKAVFQEIANEEPIATHKRQIATRAPEETTNECVEIGQVRIHSVSLVLATASRTIIQDK